MANFPTINQRSIIATIKCGYLTQLGNREPPGKVFLVIAHFNYWVFVRIERHRNIIEWINARYLYRIRNTKLSVWIHSTSSPFSNMLRSSRQSISQFERWKVKRLTRTRIPKLLGRKNYFVLHSQLKIFLSTPTYHRTNESEQLDLHVKPEYSRLVSLSELAKLLT